MFADGMFHFLYNLFEEEKSTFLQWVVAVRTVLQLPDYYLTLLFIIFIMVGSSRVITDNRSRLMATFMEVCNERGVLIADNKKNPKNNGSCNVFAIFKA